MSLIEKYIKAVLPAIEAANKEFPGPSDFVHLHNHSLYSALDGVASPEDYFAGCKYFNLPAFAITDHGTMASMPDAYFAAKKNNVKQIPGCEFYFNDYHHIVEEMKTRGIEISSIKDSDPELWERYSRNRHLTVLASNMIGYRNMLRISNTAWQTSVRYNKARINFDLLKQHKEGLIIISGCLNGPVCHELRKAIKAKKSGDSATAEKYYKNAIQYINKFREEFGDNYYIEFQMHGDAVENSKDVFRQLVQIAKALDIKGVITNDCHYYLREDFELQKTMMAIAQGVVVSDPNLFHVNCDEQFFKTRSQLRQTFYKYDYDKIMTPEMFEQCCDNTVAIHEKCTGFIPDMSPKLPSIENADEELVKRVSESLKKKGLWDKTERYYSDGRLVTYREQAKIELKRIIDKKFSSYFLIMQDLISYSVNTLQMPVGPGRGSTAGCLVSYALGIHQMDPLAWGLSFNRFLSESRGGNLLEVTME